MLICRLISIQGNYVSSANDLYTRYEFKPGIVRKDCLNKSNYFVIEDSERNKTGISQGIAYTELLTDINLVFHIKPEQEEYLNTIYEGLKKPKEYLSLGRREDLLIIDNVEIIYMYPKIFLKNVLEQFTD